MAAGEYKLAVGRATGCAYAHVRLEAEEAPDGIFSVDAEAVEPWWREAAVVGVRYAADKCRKPGAFRVSFTWIRTTHVDTNQMAVIFAAYHAACEAFGIPPDERVRLRPDWVYEFPK